MLPSSLLILAVLGGHYATSLRAQAGARFQLRLREGGSVFKEGDSFGLILRTPRKQVPDFSVLKVVLLGKRPFLRWSVARESCDGKVFSWLVVRGLTRQEDVAGFLLRPQDWSWAQITENCGAGEQTRGELRFTPRGTKVVAHGRIAGPRGQPPLGLQYSIEERMESGEYGVTPWSDRCVVGMDPQSGRLWVQAPGSVGDKELFLSVDPFMRPDLHLAGVFHVPLKKGKPLRIQVTRESRLHLNPTLPPREWVYPIVARLIPSQGKGKVHELRAAKGWRFESVSPGTYLLRITSQSPEEVFFEKKGLVLEEGKTLVLENAFDVMPQLKPVTIRVVDDREQGLEAVIDQIFLGKNKHWFSRASTSADGVARRLVSKKRGGYFRVRARGWAPVLLLGLAADTKVALQRPIELDVVVQGLPPHPGPSKPLAEDPDMELTDRGSFVLRAEPSQGFPPRARWGLLEYTERWRKGPGQPLKLERQVYCRGRIQEADRARIRLPGSGSWRFSVWVSRRHTMKSFALPGPIDVSRGQGKLTLRIPRETADAMSRFLRPAGSKASGGKGR